MTTTTFFCSYDFLARALNLPPHAVLAAVREGEHNIVAFKVAIEGEWKVPEGKQISVQSLAEIGESIRDPEKFSVDIKGQVRGAPQEDQNG
jgi:hypothetical protein